MSCPTCDHTMQCLFNPVPQEIRQQSIFWCPRCGTLKGIDLEGLQVVPDLVGRARSFEFCLNGSFCQAWYSHGMEEAINIPCNRPGNFPTTMDEFKEKP
jgi:hypothetical protein